MAANVPDPQRLLSVQSHVVSGYVGNRSATFPLQLLGWDVDVANTVQFSNHTGYGRWGGLRFDASHLEELFGGLEKNGLLRYSRMLSGYMPSAAVVSTVLNMVKKLKSQDAGSDAEELIYLLDPVMGDMGRGMYVAPEVLPIYKQMLPFSTIITPNQFEAQVLADEQITDLASLKKVLWKLHSEHNVPHVIITSVELPEADLAKIGAVSRLEDGRTPMLQIGSSRGQAKSIDDLEIWMIQFPEVEGYFSGVGDTFAALTLGRFQPMQPVEAGQGKPLTPIARASELAIASLQGILRNTCKVIEKLEKQEAETATPEELAQLDDAEKRVRMMRKRELRIIQSRSEIENPTVVYKAKWIA